MASAGRVRTHYQCLGVAATASAEDIRTAYRERARQLHPDRVAATDARDAERAAREMAAVNDAWRVLRDPAARQRYDASLRGAGATGLRAGPDAHRTAAGPGGRGPVDDRPLVPEGAVRVVRGVPWMLLLAVLAVIFVFSAFARRGGDGGEVVGREDGVVTAGSCVAVVDGRTVAEVACGEGADGRVDVLVSAAQPCAVGLESYLTVYGQRACVRRGR